MTGRVESKVPTFLSSILSPVWVDVLPMTWFVQSKLLTFSSSNSSCTFSVSSDNPKWLGVKRAKLCFFQGFFYFFIEDEGEIRTERKIILFKFFSVRNRKPIS